MSTNPFFNNIDFDDTNIQTLNTDINNNVINTNVGFKKTDASFILKGKRDGALQTLSSAY